jgi:hypothetical protein
MLILAWYTLVLSALGIIATCTDSKKDDSVRFYSVLLQLPILAFAIIYVMK